MHAVTWRTARCASRRIPAAFIAGQRRHLPRARPFHGTSTAHYAAVEPPPSSETHDRASSEQDGKDKQGLEPRSAEEAAAAAEAVGEDEDPAVLAEKLQRSREKVRQYSSALKRSSKSRQQEDVPPIHIPSRFLHQNVKFPEHLRRDRHGRWGVAGYNKPRAEGTLNFRKVVIRKGGEVTSEEDLVKLSLPLPQKLCKVLETLAEREKEGESRLRYEVFLEKMNKLYKKSDKGKRMAHESTLEELRGGKDAKKDAPSVDQSLHFALYLEVLTAIAGSLSTADQTLCTSFPSAKANLILHTPNDNGITRLDSLVEDVASELDADIISLDAQDIAELVGDYLGDGSDPSAYSIRTLGYETHRSRSEDYEFDEDDAEDFEAEEDAEDFQDDSISPGGRPKAGSKSTKKQAAFVVSGVQAINLGDIFKPANISGGKGSARSPSISDFFGSATAVRPQSSATAQWDDMKLAAFLDALLDANITKRADTKRLPKMAGVSEEESTKTEDQVGAASNPDSIKSAPLRVGPRLRGVEITWEKNQTLIPQISKERRPRTIVLIKDYKELSVTQQGARVLDKITELVQRRRGEGSQIMIVGTTASAELVPDLSRAGIKGLQAENEDSYFRTILVPLGPITVPPFSLTSKQSDETLSTLGMDFDFEHKARIREINKRHIEDMLRRLVPKFESFESWPDSLHYGYSHLRVFNFHEVHRLALTAIGLQHATTVSTTVKPVLLDFASFLVGISDEVKFAWAAEERQVQQAKDLAEEAPRAPKAPTTSTDLRLERIQKNANKHEKKLLAGVVNPQNIKTTFSDVHAPLETIDALKTMTSLSLQRPDAFTYGVLAADKIPGLLLYGPPGTGKTLLAKAVAKESGATVLEVSGSEVYDMYVGEGEKNVRAIFSLARKLSPCVVFIDEADAIFGSRSGSRNRTSHREVLNQFLKEWDGMSDLSVFIMVATNRPFDMDDAVMRRLPRRLLVDLPTQKDREAILRIHLKDEQLGEGVKLDELAARTPFYSGSDLKNVCVAAALACVREENEAAAKFREAMKLSQSSAEPPSSSTSTTDATAADETSEQDAAQAAPEPVPVPETVPEPEYTYPAKRTLLPHHFDKALQEISASVSEDMSSLAAIRKFDEQYGDRRGKRKRSAWGFHLADMQAKESDVRVRNP